MPRINVYEDLPTDARFIDLCDEVGRMSAYGSLLLLWERGQEYWRKGRQHIPKEHFDRLPNKDALVRCGFAKSTEQGGYCSGAEDRWGFLLRNSDKGKASAKARLEKYGTAIPVNAKNHRTATEPPPNRTEPSPSPSPSKRKKSKKSASSSLGTLVWESYSKSWKLKYGIEVPRSAKISVQCKSLAALVGTELAVEMAHWYPSYSDPFHVKSRHPLGLLLQQAQSLLVEFSSQARDTGRPPAKSDAEVIEEVLKKRQAFFESEAAEIKSA